MRSNNEVEIVSAINFVSILNMSLIYGYSNLCHTEHIWILAKLCTSEAYWWSPQRSDNSLKSDFSAMLDMMDMQMQNW